MSLLYIDLIGRIKVVKSPADFLEIKKIPPPIKISAGIKSKGVFSNFSSR